MIIIASSEYLYMGNKLIQFASFIAFAEENNINLINPSFAPYSHHFKGTENNFLCRYPQKKSWFKGNKKSRMFFYKTVYHLSRNLAKVRLKNNIIRSVDIGWEKELIISEKIFIEESKKTKLYFLQGWNFKNDIDITLYREKIKKYFSPIDTYQKNIDELISRIKGNNDIVIGIHIRQGDYKTFQGGKYYYETKDYVNAMRKFSEKFPEKKIIFLVCSNSKQNLALFDGLPISLGTGHPVEDMYAFSYCNYIIGPPSTYTMWASFYGNKPLYMMEDAVSEIKLENFRVYDYKH